MHAIQVRSHRLKVSLIATAIFSSGVATAANHDIRLVNFQGFVPNTLTINVGDTVTFINEGGDHNVVADDGSFRCARGCDGIGTGNGNSSATVWSNTITFNTPGNFGFHCQTHGAPNVGMFGTLLVQGTAPPPPPPANLGPGYTGAWFNPAQDGHGIFIEILPNNIMVAAWYVFAPGGGQSWIVANGPISGNTANLTGSLATGTRFPPNFAAADVVRTPWGALNFTFSDCNTGRLDYSSTLAGYGSGSIPLSRLTLPAGSACAPSAAASQ